MERSAVPAVCLLAPIPGFKVSGAAILPPRPASTFGFNCLQGCTVLSEMLPTLSSKPVLPLLGVGVMMERGWRESTVVRWNSGKVCGVTLWRGLPAWSSLQSLLPTACICPCWRLCFLGSHVLPARLIGHYIWLLSSVKLEDWSTGQAPQGWVQVEVGDVRKFVFWGAEERNLEAKMTRGRLPWSEAILCAALELKKRRFSSPLSVLSC